MIIFPKSIKGRLFYWFFISSSTLLVSLGIVLYYESKNVILSSIDQTLHSKMQLLTGLLHEEHGKIEFEFSDINAGEYSIPHSGYYYKIIMNGKTFATSPSLVDEGFDLAPGTIESYNNVLRKRVYTSRGPDNEPIRVLRYDFEFLGRDTIIFITENLGESLRMIKTLRSFLLIIIPSCILLLSLIGLWIAKKSLNPLIMFSSNIERITHRTLGERVEARAETKELTGIADSFNKMLDRLQNAFEAERRLIADASHELKTPVSVLKAQCDVLLQRERTKEEYREALKIVRTVSENMGRLINHLLSIARLDSGILSPQNFKTICLKDCIEKTLSLIKPIAQQRRIRIKTSLPDGMFIFGDEDSLTEAFLNLADNAVRYNRDNGTIDVVAVETGSDINITIRDTGIGIRDDDLARIFERFYRADTSRNSEGTGLGLSIAKTIIEAQGGRINATSEIGKGSCLTVTLPFTGQGT